jgi:hypothetical protein
MEERNGLENSLVWNDFGDIGGELDIKKVYDNYSDDPFSAVIYEFSNENDMMFKEYQNLLKIGEKGYSKVVNFVLGERQSEMFFEGKNFNNIDAFRDFYYDIARQLILGLKDTENAESKEFKAISNRFKNFSRIYSRNRKDRSIINDFYDVGSQIRKLVHVASPLYMPILPIFHFNDLPIASADQNENMIDSIKQKLRENNPPKSLINQLNMSLDLIDGFVDSHSRNHFFPKSETWFSIPGWYFDIVKTREFFIYQRVSVDVLALQADIKDNLRNLVLIDRA